MPQSPSEKRNLVESPEISLADIVKTEIAYIKERYLYSTDPTLSDPVFEGMVRSLNSFYACIDRLLERIFGFSSMVEKFTAETEMLARKFYDEYANLMGPMEDPNDVSIVSDAYHAQSVILEKFSSHSFSSSSVLGRFKRDLNYNVLGPLRSHLQLFEDLRSLIGTRNRKLIQLSSSMRDGCGNSLDAETLALMKADFESIDSDLFEWMYIIDEYRGDICDSLLQTIKYLEYEFFSASAHAIAETLPERIEFRPLVEMTPKQLNLQRQVERDNSSVVHESFGQTSRLSDYSKKLMTKRDSPQSLEAAVDPLSLGALMAQGFEEGACRRALRSANNDTQRALDLLIHSNPRHEVRIPTTLKRVKDLKKRLAQSTPRKIEEAKPNECETVTEDTTISDSLISF